MENDWRHLRHIVWNADPCIGAVVFSYSVVFARGKRHWVAANNSINVLKPFSDQLDGKKGTKWLQRWNHYFYLHCSFTFVFIALENKSWIFWIIFFFKLPGWCGCWSVSAVDSLVDCGEWIPRSAPGSQVGLQEWLSFSTRTLLTMEPPSFLCWCECAWSKPFFEKSAVHYSHMEWRALHSYISVLVFLFLLHS